MGQFIDHPASSTLTKRGGHADHRTQTVAVQSTVLQGLTGCRWRRDKLFAEDTSDAHFLTPGCGKLMSQFLTQARQQGVMGDIR